MAMTVSQLSAELEKQPTMKTADVYRSMEALERTGGLALGNVFTVRGTRLTVTQKLLSSFKDRYLYKTADPDSYQRAREECWKEYAGPKGSLP